MSTSYGKIRLRDGRCLSIEAYGTTNVVKLECDSDGPYVGGAAGAFTPVSEIAIDSIDALDRLVAALEQARDHCWPKVIPFTPEFYTDRDELERRVNAMLDKELPR